MRDAELLKLHQAVLGVSLRPESDGAAVLSLLRAGTSDILLSLHWYSGADYHSLVLTHVDPQEQIHFHNPNQPDNPPPSGQLLLDDAPRRIYHGPGDESVSQEVFMQWFQQREALAYLPH